MTSEKKEKMIKVFWGGALTLLVLAVLGNFVWQTTQFRRCAHTLKSLRLPSVHAVRIRPRTNQFGGGISFLPPDPLITELLQAVTDLRAYHGSPKGIASLDHEWSIEIETTEGHLIRLRCHLPANGDHVTHGTFEQFHYGKFQSQGLFRWYQAHHHRWSRTQGNDEGISIEISP